LRERERERERNMQAHMHVYMHISSKLSSGEETNLLKLGEQGNYKCLFFYTGIEEQRAIVFLGFCPTLQKKKTGSREELKPIGNCFNS
jgi:hypothetical protein